VELSSFCFRRPRYSSRAIDLKLCPLKTFLQTPMAVV